MLDFAGGAWSLCVYTKISVLEIRAFVCYCFLVRSIKLNWHYHIAGIGAPSILERAVVVAQAVEQWCHVYDSLGSNLPTS